VLISAERYLHLPLLQIIQFGWGLIRHSMQLVSGTGACRWFAIQNYCRGKECLDIASSLSHAIMACTRTTGVPVCSDVGTFAYSDGGRSV